MPVRGKTHIHFCTQCNSMWEHEPEKPCLAAVDYTCPKCKDPRYGESQKGWNPLVQP